MFYHLPFGYQKRGVRGNKWGSWAAQCCTGSRRLSIPPVSRPERAQGGCDTPSTHCRSLSGSLGKGLTSCVSGKRASRDPCLAVSGAGPQHGSWPTSYGGTAAAGRAAAVTAALFASGALCHSASGLATALFSTDYNHLLKSKPWQDEVGSIGIFHH